MIIHSNESTAQVSNSEGGLRCRVGGCNLPAEASEDGTVACRLMAKDSFPRFPPPVQPTNCCGGALSTKSCAAPVAEGTEPKEPKEEADFGRREGESRGAYLRREYSALKPFAIISLSYLLFTTTDGAVSSWPCESLN